MRTGGATPVAGSGSRWWQQVMTNPGHGKMAQASRGSAEVAVCTQMPDAR